MKVSPVAFAFVLDLLLGDPPFAWHPVRLMGHAVSWVDARWRTRGAGVALALLLPLAAWALGAALCSAAAAVGPWAAWVVSALLIYFCVACRDMLDHARAVLQALQSDDIQSARERVSRIVGRDCSQIDRAGILRACMESVAESACDGLVAPLFFAFLGGAPCALAYKAVSTLDSMIGYRDGEYARFGWASARLDDALNWIPARITALLASLLAPLVGGNAVLSWKTAWRDAPSQPSPNSGWPEAAFAGALGVQLGGPLVYRGVLHHKAFLGDPGQPLRVDTALKACRLFLLIGLSGVLAGEGILRALG